MELSGLLVIAICMLAGVGIARIQGAAGQGIARGAPKALSHFVITVPLPALILVRMHALLRSGASWRGLWVPLSMAWVQFACAWLFAMLLARALRLSRATQGALVLTVGLGNTSFVGFPLLLALLGPDSMPTAVLIDQSGTFLAFSTLGVWTAATFGAGAISLRQIVGRALTFPPMIALLAVVVLAPFALPQVLRLALEKIAASLVPVALVAVGMQLRLAPRILATRAPELAAALLAKLVLVPALFIALYMGIAKQRGVVVQTTILESAMAPMITSAVLADESGLDAELAHLMVGVGVILSLVTVPLWAWLLRLLS